MSLKPNGHPIFNRTWAPGVLEQDRYGEVYRFLSDEDLARFTVTAVNGGSAAVLDTIPLGALQITGAATTDDAGANLQLDAVNIKLAAGQSVRVRGVVRLNDATESDFLFGIAPVDTSLIAGVTDFVGFVKADGAATIEAQYWRDSGTVAKIAGTPTKTLVADTDYYFEIVSHVQDAAGAGTSYFYWNGEQLGVINHTVNHLWENQSVISLAFQSGNNTGTKTAILRAIAWDMGPA